PEETLKKIRDNDPDLISLDLCWEQITDAEAQALAGALRDNTTLTSLVLGGSDDITDEGARALAGALQTNTTLKSLDLSGNRITDEGAQALAFQLQNNKTLTSLNLNFNRITVAGAEALADALQTNTTLTSLHLNVNQVTDTGVQALTRALQTNTTLTSLHLSNNQIRFAGARALAGALRNNRTLTSLDLYGNQITDAGAQAIADALRNNRTLTSLDLYGNQIADAGAQALAGALRDNTTLTSLNLFAANLHIQADINRLLARNRDLPGQISDEIYRRFTRRTQNGHQDLSEIELKFATTASPESCQRILNNFLGREDITGVDHKQLFDHIKSFPGGLRMMLSSAQSLKEHGMPELDLSHLLAAKGVVKDLNEQTNVGLSKLTVSLRRVLGYLTFDDIKRSSPVEPTEAGGGLAGAQKSKESPDQESKTGPSLSQQTETQTSNPRVGDLGGEEKTTQEVSPPTSVVSVDVRRAEALEITPTPERTLENQQRNQDQTHQNRQEARRNANQNGDGGCCVVS
ncbi:MAG: hypothetical protein KGP29_05970, partial [Proteobacteria bacterium]|nr:hypothetical protein [Pseudomonadota bacterium]